MARAAFDLVSVVEEAYRLHLSDQAWLDALLAACAPGFERDHGGAAVIFEREHKDPKRIISTVANHGMDPRLLATMFGAFHHGSAAERDRSLRQGGPVRYFSSVVDVPVAKHPLYASFASTIKFDDLVMLRAVNPDGTGVIMGAPIRGKREAPALGRWPQLAAHLAAALRLRRSGRDIAKADAMLSANGELLDGGRNAVDARKALRAAVQRIEAGRNARRRAGDETAIDAWTALVDGRWSLVDHFESDGKRFLLAMVNAANAPDPRALTSDERPVLHLAAMGHSNKLIAYELGIPSGTVATRLASVMRKLAVKTRVEIIERYTALRSVSSTAMGDVRMVSIDPVGRVDSQLTDAEAAVARLAVRGQSNKQIAKTRNCSSRTVGNLLARAYAKLGVASRAELTLALRRGG